MQASGLYLGTAHIANQYYYATGYSHFGTIRRLLLLADANTN